MWATDVIRRTVEKIVTRQHEDRVKEHSLAAENRIVEARERVDALRKFVEELRESSDDEV